MPYRCVFIRKSDRLSLKDNNLTVLKDDKTVNVPLEDISMVVLEDPQTVITSRLLSALAENYIGLLICDNDYNPISISLPLSTHYKQLAVFNLQMNVKKPLYSQLWCQIIESKIQNQLMVVGQTSHDEFAIDKLIELKKSVKSGDKDNAESTAARIFFNGVYGHSFTREQKSKDPINSALNYGYTILMSCMSRLLAAYGFNTILGIHHCSYVNNFNLSCDLMEPFRPIVDRLVYYCLDDLDYPLPIDIRKKLVDLLQSPIKIDNKVYQVQNAMEAMVLSYIKALEREDSSLLLVPLIIDETGELDEFVL